MSLTLKRKEIIRGKETFIDLFRKGRRIEGTFVRCLYILSPAMRENIPGVQVAFSVRKTTKRAVDRNRIKRLMREAYRLNKEIFLGGFDSTSGHADIVFAYKEPRGGTTIVAFV